MSFPQTQLPATTYNNRKLAKIATQIDCAIGAFGFCVPVHTVREHKTVRQLTVCARYSLNQYYT